MRVFNLQDVMVQFVMFYVGGSIIALYAVEMYEHCCC
jgi:hypothetical protein